MEPEQIQANSVSEENTEKEKDLKYFLVVYLTDGSGHFYPENTKEECQKLLDQIKNRTKWKDKYKDFRIIKRNMLQYKSGYIL